MFLARRQTLKYLGLLAGTVAGRRFLAEWLPSGLAPKGASARPEGSMPQMDHLPVPDAEHYLPRFFKPDEFKTVESLTELIIPTDDKPGAKEAEVARYIDFVVSAAAEFEPSLQLQWTQGFQLLDSLSREKYELVKEMTVEGFYTSRLGLVDVLGYKGLTFLTEFPGCAHSEHQA